MEPTSRVHATHSSVPGGVKRAASQRTDPPPPLTPGEPAVGPSHHAAVGSRRALPPPSAVPPSVLPPRVDRAPPAVGVGPASLAPALVRLHGVVLSWPQLAHLRAAAGGARRAWQHAISLVVATARCELSAALFAHQARTPGRSLEDEVGAAVLVAQGAARYEALLDLLSGGLQILADQWRISAAQLEPLISRLRSLVGPPAVFGPGALPYLSAPDDPPGRTRFPHTAVLFAAALANGWPWSLALQLFAGVLLGSFCNRGFGFITSYGLRLSPEQLHAGRWLVGHVNDQSCSGTPVSVFFDDNAVVFFQSNKSLRVERPAPPSGRAAAAARRRTRFLPDYVRLPLDTDGNFILPEFMVTSIVERRHIWARLIQMDGVTRSLVNGKLAYPRISSRVTASWLPNHRSWEDPDVKAVLGQKLATWFYQGALEYVPPGAPPPTVVEPKAAVPKKGADKYRDITDAREGNKSLEPWAVIYFTARDLADALLPLAIVSGHDVKDGYHISLFCGCTGELVWGWGVIGFYWVYPGQSEYSDSESDGEELGCEDPEPSVAGPTGGAVDTATAEKAQQAPRGQGSAHTGPSKRPQLRFKFGWRLHVGCWPWSCCGTCDKAYNGLEFDGCLARWAVAHFGQAPAGSPLNCIALCLLRHMALRNPASGERRGDSATTGNGVVWVDDFIFHKAVRAHSACSGLEGGCPVCLEHLPQAEAVDAYWVELCRKLGVPLNLDKRQRCRQQVKYAGFLFDTLRGLLLILPEKLLKRLFACLKEWAESQRVTSRFMDSVRGGVLHYPACIRNTRVLATEVLCLTGTPDENHYDTPMPVTAALVGLAA